MYESSSLKVWLAAYYKMRPANMSLHDLEVSLLSSDAGKQILPLKSQVRASSPEGPSIAILQRSLGQSTQISCTGFLLCRNLRF